MFSRVAVVFVAFVALFGSTLVHAGNSFSAEQPVCLTSESFAAPLQPLQQRQVGNLECNVDRIQIVADLFNAASSAKTLTTQLQSYVCLR